MEDLRNKEKLSKNEKLVNTEQSMCIRIEKVKLNEL